MMSTEMMRLAFDGRNASENDDDGTYAGEIVVRAGDGRTWTWARKPTYQPWDLETWIEDVIVEWTGRKPEDMCEFTDLSAQILRECIGGIVTIEESHSHSLKVVAPPSPDDLPQQVASLGMLAISRKVDVQADLLSGWTELRPCIPAQALAYREAVDSALADPENRNQMSRDLLRLSVWLEGWNAAILWRDT